MTSLEQDTTRVEQPNSDAQNVFNCRRDAILAQNELELRGARVRTR